MKVWLGICDTPNGTAFVIDSREGIAKSKLFELWSREVYPGFAQENNINDFEDLHEWNGATVKHLTAGDSGIWERI